MEHRWRRRRGGSVSTALETLMFHRATIATVGSDKRSRYDIRSTWSPSRGGGRYRKERLKLVLQSRLCGVFQHPPAQGQGNEVGTLVN